MRSAATSVDQYLDELPDERRAALSAVRDVILANLPAGIEETMNWGMISYEIPLSVVPNTYNGQPLSFAGLAAQKNALSVYLMAIYADEALRYEFERRYQASGQRLDAGKSCIRFRTIDKLPLDVIGWAVGALTMDQVIDLYANARSLRTAKASRTPRS